MAYEHTCDACGQTAEIDDDILETVLSNMMEDEDVYTAVTSHTADFALGGENADVGGGDGEVVVSLPTITVSWACPNPECESFEEEQDIELDEVMARVGFTFTNNAIETGTWSIDEIESIDSISLEPALTGTSSEIKNSGEAARQHAELEDERQQQEWMMEEGEQLVQEAYRARVCCNGSETRPRGSCRSCSR